jgi:hypothetical protein
MNGINNHQPFFIVGSGRSGNTLLHRILTNKNGIVIPPETYVFGKIFRLHNVYKNMDWEEYVNLMISTFEYHPQFYTFEIDSLYELTLELKKCEHEKRTLSHIISQFYIFYAKKKGLKLKRWGDKTPLNSMYVYRIKQLFPHARFIHMIRDGVDVAYSYVNAGLYEDYTKAAIRWEKSVDFLQKFGRKYPEDYLEVRYEEFVKEPKKNVKEIFNFLDEEFEEEILNKKNNAAHLGDVKHLNHHSNVHNKINDNSIGRGRKNLNKHDLKDIESLLKNTLKNNGYVSRSY